MTDETGGTRQTILSKKRIKRMEAYQKAEAEKNRLLSNDRNRIVTRIIGKWMHFFSETTLFYILCMHVRMYRDIFAIKLDDQSEAAILPIRSRWFPTKK